MRIWQLTGLNPRGVGGVETHISEVSRGLGERGHDVHVGPSLPPAWLEPGRAPVVEPVIVHTHGDRWPDLRLLGPKIRRRLLWIHVCHGTTIGRVIACREFMSFSGWRGSVTDYFPSHFADAAVAVSPSALYEARTYFRMKLPARVIANGVDPGIFKPLSQITLEPRVIYVGRDGDRVKNVPAILAACARVAADVPKFTLWCAPGIDYDYRVHPFVKNLGPLVAKELASTLAQCRALLLCSLYEGDPIVVHEAKALGLPIVISDIAQLRPVLKGYEGSIPVSPRNVESIAFGVRTAALGPPRTPIPQVRSWSEVAVEFETLYGELIAARR